jgi:hypothetical protein
MAVKLYEKIVKHNGGDRLSRNANARVVDDDTLIVEKVDRSMRVGEQEDMSVITHKLQEVVHEDWTLVDSYLSEHPKYIPLLHQMTMPDRVAFVKLQMQDHGWVPPKQPVKAQPTPLTPRYSNPNQYRGPIDSSWTKAANRSVGIWVRRELVKGSEKEDRWNSYHQQLVHTTKRQAGVPEDRVLGQIQNLDALESMLQYLERILHAQTVADFTDLV